MDKRHHSPHNCKKLGLAAALIVFLNSSVKAEVELNAEGLTVYGQSELPKVLYVVPWKRKVASDIERPRTESLLSDVLTPIDPDIFQRQNYYYELLTRDTK